MRQHSIGALAIAAVLALAATPRAQAPATPDLSGIWKVLNTAAWNIEDHNAQPGVPAGVGVVNDGPIPYQPWALAKRQENYTHRAEADPEAKCYLPGIPRATYTPLPFQIVQTPDNLTVLYEYAHAVRYIYTNGTPHPKGPIDWWMGDSRGRWEGNTLVVDVVHFGDQTWLDRAGNFHSDELHVTERYTPLGPDHINYQVRLEDPKVFTRPWTMSMVLYRVKDPRTQILEYECFGFDYEPYYPYPAEGSR